MKITFSKDDGHLYDVVAVNIKSGVVRLLDAGQTKPNAEAIVALAVARRGVDEEFFADVPANSYATGDKWGARE
jgi:hypothetical protein